MRVLVVGGGGREHALAWRLARSASVEQVFAAPGNPGTASAGTNVAAASVEEIVDFVVAEDIDLTVVGPEQLLVEGLADRLIHGGRLVCGPQAAAARLEGSKAFAKEFMLEHGIPTAQHRTVTKRSAAQRAAQEFGFPVVMKADGLAAGKGVLIVEDDSQLALALEAFFEQRKFGASGDQVVVEEFLTGEEVSFIALCDGERVVPWAASKDYKRVDDGDRGPNTGGMGAHSPDGFLSAEQAQQVVSTVMEPTVLAMRNQGTPFRGFLYAGLILTEDGAKVLEFNVRLGDPEAQPLLMRFADDLGIALRAAAQGRLQPELVRFNPDAAACVVLAAENYPGAPRTGDEIVGIEAAEAENAVVFQAGTTSKEGRLMTSGGRVLTVGASASSLADALDAAYSAAGKIRFNGCHYRRDIGARVIGLTGGLAT